MNLDKGWKVLQDVNNNGEFLGVNMPDFNGDDSFLATISPWDDIERLDFLQLLYANTPYYGRELRYFNASPWWYKNEFTLTETEASTHAVITFGGVDYYAKVWLNGLFLGQHEGYFAPFSFDISGKLNKGINTLIVQVSSPNETELIRFFQQGMDISPTLRFLTAKKRMVKGTYEHADTFIQRDVNPIGIWRGVSIDFYEQFRPFGTPKIVTIASSGTVTCEGLIDGVEAGTVQIKYTITEAWSGKVACEKAVEVALSQGENRIFEKFVVTEPKLWDIWERGSQHLYSLTAVIIQESEFLLFSEKFGFREIELIRNEQITQFVLNGEAIYLRGTSYFPDVYLSNMTKNKYKRDIKRMIALGFNAIRVHVHVENTEFYEICDELGMLVMQDSDLSWFHSTTPEFAASAISVVSDMVKLLRNHPSIFCWVIMNEPDMWKISAERGETTLEEPMVSMMNDVIGPEVTDAVNTLDSRPYIKGSMFINDRESGDDHNYTGSLSGEGSHYLDIYGQRLKLTTEFGMDLPPCIESLKKDKRIYDKLKKFISDDGITHVAEYRRNYIKYIIEYHRIKKAMGCSGYFQFDFSDLCLQSFYGIYDYFGEPKSDIAVFENINKPLGVFMEYHNAPVAIWIVNDTLEDYKNTLVQWIVLENGTEILHGEKKVMLERNSCLRVNSLDFAISPDSRYNVMLTALYNGKTIAKNCYINVFQPPEHPKGHPLRVDSELGMRLFNA